MCGIAGIIGLENGLTVLPQWLQTMTIMLRHRGPDDEGFVYFNRDQYQCFGGKDTPNAVFHSELPYALQSTTHHEQETANYIAGLAHRRLSILDVSASGHQPMCDLSQRFWITYNGEIYNYQEIKQELLLLGHTFFSQSDTEVILHSYMQWGKQCVQRFNGMWAFAIFDKLQQTLFCSRDRFGVKPFYYILNQHYFAFASEQKALLTLPFVEKKLNEEAVYDYLVLGTTETEEQSFFKGIYELKPSHNLSITNQQVNVEHYYSLAFNPDFGSFSVSKAREHEDRVKELLEDAVRLRLRSDVPVGACLSGGIDSSALVCIADRLRPSIEPFHVFTAIYPGLEEDESEWARKVVNSTATKWHTIQTKPEDLLQHYNDLIYSQDIPFFGSSTLSQFKVMELIAKNGIKVTLDGQGADELFSGYPNHFYSSFYHDLLHFNVGNLSKINRAGANAKMNFARFLVKKLLVKLPFGIGYSHLKNTKYDFQLLQDHFWNRHQDRYYQQKRASTASLNDVLHGEYAGWQLKYLMRTADRNSMRHSVESRVPFADDHRLAEYVFSIPSAYKLHQVQSKYLLRESMKGAMPEVIRQRWDKKGFATPEYRWFKNMKNELKGLVDENLEPFVNVGQLRKNWDTIFDNQIAGNTLGISRFVILSMWRKRFGI